MPVRLSGVLDWSGGLLADRRREEEWEEAYPAPGPWRRVKHRVGSRVRVTLDACGDSSLSRCMAVEGQAGVGVAGTIRLDRRDELRAELGVNSAAADAAVIVAAYDKWGAPAFARLAGDFSFVLWDDPARIGYLVRDSFGVRRLHYAQCDDAIVFSTDVEGVLAWRTVDRTPDPVTILDNLLARYQTRGQTFFRSVSRVLPGHHLAVRGGRTELRRHVEVPRYPTTFRSLPEFAEAFRFELARSVKDRLPASGPVACHVSGGLDSMSVASLANTALAEAQRAKDLVLLNARFVGLASDEGPVAVELSRYLKVPLRQWNGRIPETSDLEHSRLAWPFGRSSMAGARQGDLELARHFNASIILGGVGGNQIATESGFFRDAWQTGALPGYARALIELAGSDVWRGRRPHLRRTLAEARKAIPRPWSRNDGEGDDDRVDGLTMPCWLGPISLSARVQLPGTGQGNFGPPVLGSWMADAIWDSLVDDPVHVWTLEHEDARATEQGLEFRFPYLSWDLLALVLSIPPRLRVPRRADRHLQRLALRGVLPERLRTRITFVNFNEPIMLNAEAASPWIERLLTTGTWAAQGFVERTRAHDEFMALSRSVGEPFTEDRARTWREIRDVAALEAWLRRI